MLKPRYGTFKEAVSDFRQLMKNLDVRMPKDATIREEDITIEECLQVLGELEELAGSYQEAAEFITNFYQLAEGPPPIPADAKPKKKSPPPIPADAKKREPSSDTKAAMADLPHKKVQLPDSSNAARTSAVKDFAKRDRAALTHAVSGGKSLVASLRKKAAQEKGKLKGGIAINRTATSATAESTEARASYLSEFRHFAGLDPHEQMPYDPGRAGSVRYTKKTSK